ncbi:MAG: DNA polymerase III subunit epsilon [Coxiellaceae bacterium]|nr:DNA polymerase III subunit epsilon [Coxiellaceae bacterium]
MRQIVLDTETTGLSPEAGHRIIEIGAVELVNRRLTGNNYHHYINPEREVDVEAFQVHGISNEFLEDKPVFAELIDAFIAYIDGAELIIHNAPFDVGFLNHEFKLISPKYRNIAHYCVVLDTLAMAKKKHPGQRNNLDALCKRYDVNNDNRVLHGALLDAEILADVYLRMTGGQINLFAAETTTETKTINTHDGHNKVAREQPLPVISASAEECRLHEAFMARITES